MKLEKEERPKDKKEDKDKVSDNERQAKTPNEEIKEKLSQDNQREKIDDIAENMTAESYEQLNNLNEISKQNEQVNGTAYANLKEETKDSVVAKATETVGGFGGALESMEEENDNQQKGEHTL